MNKFKTRRSLALLLGAMLVAVPVSSFAGDLGADNGSPSPPDTSDSSPGGDSNYPNLDQSESEQGDDSGGAEIYDCSSYDPCSPRT